MNRSEAPNELSPTFLQQIVTLPKLESLHLTGDVDVMGWAVVSECCSDNVLPIAKTVTQLSLTAGTEVEVCGGGKENECVD